MNWRAWWRRFSVREQRLIAAAGTILALLFLRHFVLTPFSTYRESVREEIAANGAMLDNTTAYLARGPDLTSRREMLQARFRELRAQLLPGDTPTLAAANLQDTLHSLAAEKGVDIQSTQVMREETLGDFRRIAVRLSVMGEIRQLAEFVAGVEYGPLRVSIPFLEISKRGAVLRGQSGRALAATVEVSAFVQGSEESETEGSGAAAGVGPTPAEGGPAAPGDGTLPTGGVPSVADAAQTPAAPLPTARETTVPDAGDEAS